MSNINYMIPAEYNIRTQRIAHDDRSFKDEWQNEIYVTAKLIAEKNNYKKIVDIGCGSAFKLLKYFDEYDTTGYELDPCYSFLINKYPNKRWIKSVDFSGKLIESELIICADVIEHINDPTELLLYIQRSEYKCVVFSTPDRKQLYSPDHVGPPKNTDHVREWTYDEFDRYISKYFRISRHFLCEDLSTCQCIVCEPF